MQEVINTSVGSGSTETGSVANNKDMKSVFEVDGDTDSSDVTIDIYGKLKGSDNFSHIKSYANEDLTQYDNESKIFRPNTKGCVEEKVKITNNGASQSSIIVNKQGHDG